MAVSGTWSSLCRGGWCLILLVVLLLPTAVVHATDVVPQAPPRHHFCTRSVRYQYCRSAAPANQTGYPSSCSRGSCAIDHVEMHEAAGPEASSWVRARCPTDDLIKCSGNVTNKHCCTAIQTAMARGGNNALGCVFKRLKEVGADKCKMMNCCYCNRWCTSCGQRLCRWR